LGGTVGRISWKCVMYAYNAFNLLKYIGTYRPTSTTQQAALDLAVMNQVNVGPPSCVRLSTELSNRKTSDGRLPVLLSEQIVYPRPDLGHYTLI